MIHVIGCVRGHVIRKPSKLRGAPCNGMYLHDYYMHYKLLHALQDANELKRQRRGSWGQGRGWPGGYRNWACLRLPLAACRLVSAEPDPANEKKGGGDKVQRERQLNNVAIFEFKLVSRSIWRCCSKQIQNDIRCR